MYIVLVAARTEVSTCHEKRKRIVCIDRSWQKPKVCNDHKIHKTMVYNIIKDTHLSFTMQTRSFTALYPLFFLIKFQSHGTNPMIGHPVCTQVMCVE